VSLTSMYTSYVPISASAVESMAKTGSEEKDIPGSFNSALSLK